MPDDEQNRFGRSLGEGYSYVALGFTFAVAILAFGALGWVVDGWLGTRPWFALVGAAIGGFGGVMTLYYRVQRDTKRGSRTSRCCSLGWGWGGWGWGWGAGMGRSAGGGGGGDGLRGWRGRGARGRE